MRKILSVLLTVIMVLSVFCITSCAENTNAENNEYNITTLVMQLDSSIMTINGTKTNIDNDGTVPMIIDGRTLIPVRAMIEALNGSVSWDSDTQTATLNHDDDEIRLTINSSTAYFNNEEKTIDVSPVIINGRTMLPVRFIAESFGFEISWNENEKSITVVKSEPNTDTESVAAEEKTEQNNEAQNNDKENKKVLIAYFTWSGNTDKMADTIKDATNGTVFEITPLNPYPEDYTKCTEVALEERDNNSRPEIKDLPDNLDEYDSIFIGYPIWWHTAPMIVGSFLENYDLTGKDIYPFTQSASMDKEQFNNSMEFVKECAKDANVHDGLFVRASDSEGILAYLRENGFID